MELARFGDYRAEIRRLGREWAPRGLEVLLGLEIDWVPGLCSPRDRVFEEAGLDYSIGSVHFVDLPGSGRFAVDDGAEAFESYMARFEGAQPGRALYEGYYLMLSQLIESGGFDILGHFDLVRKNNVEGRWFDEASRGYLDAAIGAARLLKGRDIVVEINVGGMSRGKVKTPYPSLPILRELRADGVRITFSADAHAPLAPRGQPGRRPEPGQGSGLRLDRPALEGEMDRDGDRRQLKPLKRMYGPSLDSQAGRMPQKEDLSSP